MSETRQKPTIVGIGELLWDLLPDGRHLGGAPPNFAYHAGRLGAEAIVVSRVGDDADGRLIRERMTKLGLTDRYVQTDPDHPTGTVPVTLDEQGKPAFTIIEDVAYDYLQWDPDLQGLAARAQVVCFGSLAQRNPVAGETIQRFLAAARGATVIYDVNFRQNFYSREVVQRSLAAADVVKLNDDELPTLCELIGLSADEDLVALSELGERFGLKLVCLTLGAGGCALFTPEAQVVSPGYAVPVADTVGSGDAFTAAMVTAWLDGRPLEEIADWANLTGACVAARRGATPTIHESDLVELAASEPKRILARTDGGRLRAP